MKDELEKAVVELIHGAVKNAEGAKEFVLAQLPDYIQQLLMWHAWYGFMLFVVAIMVLVLWFVVEYKFVQLGRRSNWDNDAWGLGYVLLGSVPRIAPFLIILNTANITWLKISIAPKVWLIEYAAGLVK